MIKVLLLVFSLHLWMTGFSQNGSEVDPDTQVQINVLVINPKQQPLPGEEIFFIDWNTKEQQKGKSNDKGRFSLLLRAGTRYAIKIRTLTDTAAYTDFDLPALKKGNHSLKSYSIDIEYEPARVFTLQHVYFDHGKPTLRSLSYKQLDEIALYMKSRTETYEIGGHTDNTGKASENDALSQKRALAVKNYLVKKGVAGERLKAVGYGASMPVADNTNAEGRQKNRRTEIRIL